MERTHIRTNLHHINHVLVKSFLDKSLPSSATSSWSLRFKWGLFFFIILLSWVLLYSIEHTSHDAFQHAHQHAYQQPLPSYWHIISMWLLMSIAMMMPTLVPTLKVLSNILLNEKPNKQLSMFVWFVSAYNLVWGVSALLLASVHFSLYGKLSFEIDLNYVYALLLLLAGFYQFSSFKQRCLVVCQNPMMFFMKFWRDNNMGAFRMGIRQGLFCLGCCWALMALCLIGGAMQIVWMGGLLLLMLSEKIIPWPVMFSRAIGGILIASSSLFLFF